MKRHVSFCLVLGHSLGALESVSNGTQARCFGGSSKRKKRAFAFCTLASGILARLSTTDRVFLSS